MLRRIIVAVTLALALPVVAAAQSFTAYGPHMGFGQGYDQSFLAEKRHPTAADLDAAFPTNPVILLHVSGHMLVANSAALRKMRFVKVKTVTFR